MNMIEKVARALCRNHYKQYPELIDLIEKAGWEDFVEDAKIAIEAMKEPTEEMLNRGGFAECPDDTFLIGNEAAKECYLIMIEAALKE